MDLPDSFSRRNKMKLLQLFSVTEAKTVLINSKMVSHASWKSKSPEIEATEDISKTRHEQGGLTQRQR